MMRLLVFICALFVFGACNAGTLNIRQPNGATKQIELDTEKRTVPALAMRVGGTVYYANLIETTTCASGNACVSYGNKTYIIHDNIKYKFTITTTNMAANTTFNFSMSAIGTFAIDWGDGTVDEIIRTNTTNTTYSHTYTMAGIRTIGFNGNATGYSGSAAISFSDNTNVATIDGSLGAIFPTRGTTWGSQPIFYSTFDNCTELTGNIPENLFDGVSGAAGDMFRYTFRNCSGLTGNIPENLFGGISGVGDSMFRYTFQNCSGLTGNIPKYLFKGVSGSVNWMFGGTFYGCSGLTGTIPDGLFGNISGTTRSSMFSRTFMNCTNLNGSTARNADGTELYDIVNPYTEKKWWDERPDMFEGMYTNTGITGARD